MDKEKDSSVSETHPGLPAGKVIVLTSVMFTFISFWRVAAVVLSDLASTAYYIGGIVEQAIGAAAPWFILAVMLFSYAVRSVYIESCSMFVRGGVYRVVKEGMGGMFAKLSVSALLFDYVLTGPISGVSAGQYVVGLVLDTIDLTKPGYGLSNPSVKEAIKSWGAVGIACAITVYFFRKNLVGIVESSGKAVKIMKLTTVMAVIILSWSAVTLFMRGAANPIPWTPDLSKKMEPIVVPGTDRITGEPREVWVRDDKSKTFVPKLDAGGKPVPKIDEVTGRAEDPLGFAGNSAIASRLRNPAQINWWSLIGLLGILFAFGHSILAMSGEETLAQVYREVSAPKLKNFKKAAFIIFAYSLIFTAGISFLAVCLIPDEIRMKIYSDNLIAGLAMHMVGPSWARIALHAFVVLVGFLILAGAVNTALVGSNGVVSRVAEDGVLPDALLKPHPKYGTTHRILLLIFGLQIATILISRGNVLRLGEAYAFGVVWSFIFKTAAMIVLRFRMREPREFKVPLNIKIGGVEVPIGLTFIFLVLFATGIANLFSKEVATISGLCFSIVIFLILLLSEKFLVKKLAGEVPAHTEQFNVKASDEVSPSALQLTRAHRQLVWLRSAGNLAPLDKALESLDPKTTDLLVLLMKPAYRHCEKLSDSEFTLLTEVVKRAEKVGKPVKPIILFSNHYLQTLTGITGQLKIEVLYIASATRRTARQELKRIRSEESAIKCETPLLQLHAYSGNGLAYELTTSLTSGPP